MSEQGIEREGSAAEIVADLDVPQAEAETVQGGGEFHEVLITKTSDKSPPQPTAQRYADVAPSNP
jgi:hypothetical protein